MKINPISHNIKFARRIESEFVPFKTPQKPIFQAPKEYFHFVEEPKTDCFMTNSGRLLDKDGKFFEGEMFTLTPNGKKVHMVYQHGLPISSDVDGRVIKTFKNYFMRTEENTPPYAKQITTYKFDKDGNPIGEDVVKLGYYIIGDASGKIESVEKNTNEKNYLAKYEQDGSLKEKVIKTLGKDETILEKYDGKNNLVLKTIIKPNGEYEKMDATRGGNWVYDGSYITLKGFSNSSPVGRKYDIREMEIFNTSGEKVRDVKCEKSQDKNTLVAIDYDCAGKPIAGTKIRFSAGDEKSVTYIFQRKLPNNNISKNTVTSYQNGGKEMKTQILVAGQGGKKLIVSSKNECSKEDLVAMQKSVEALMSNARHNDMHFPYEAHDDYYFNVFL